MTRLCTRSAWILSSCIKHYRCFSVTTPLSQRPCLVLSPYPTAQWRFHSTSFSQHATQVASTARKRAKPSSPVNAKYEHTVAQIARAASQAVRVSIQEGNHRDAFYIMNSALQMPLERGIVPPVKSRRLLNPMDFGRPVPTRLVVHSLIHALLREGNATAAGRELQKLVAIGVRFRSQTLEANVRLLCSITPGTSSTTERSFDQIDGNARGDWHAYRILRVESMRLIPETRLALELLFAARKSHHRRTERMYGWAVDACLLQGEIFVATLLFVVLVKDWQLRKVLKSSSVETEQSSDNIDARRDKRRTPGQLLFSQIYMQRLTKKIALDSPHALVTYPEKSILQSILNGIDRRLFSLDRHKVSEAARIDYENSLLYLANLLDNRSLPFGHLSPLIRTLYNCPTSRKRGYVLEDGRRFSVNVYEYSHHVLMKLCGSLPTQMPSPSHACQDILPPLDTRAYNALIYYALRHRLSPALANAVIEHMTIYRKAPLQPDITTYNILLHSSSTLRRNDLANQVLDMLRKRHENQDRSTPKRRIPPPISPASNKPGQDQNFLRHVMEPLTVPAIPPPDILNSHYPRVRPVYADIYTLCTYITHLVRTGRPGAVAEMIFDIIPELHIINHPATSPSEDNTESHGEDQRESLRRAISYGPYLYSVLLNALQKAGKTGLAERVWLLGRRAERASWIQPGEADAPRPWCLPIQAYTSMMMCYAAESRKGARLIRGTNYASSLSSFRLLEQERNFWDSRRVSNVYVKGWAYFYLRIQAQQRGYRSSEPPLRNKLAREIGLLLFNSMRGGALSVLQDLVRLQPENVGRFSPQWAAVLDSLNLPVGDARFFNAVLEIFGRRVDMQARRTHASPSWWARKLRVAQKVYVERGKISMAYDHSLVEIATNMAREGYVLPLGLRRALVGRIASRIRHTERRDHVVRPYAFPEPKKLRFRPSSMTVTKSRGLPLGRRKPEEMRRSRIEARSRTRSEGDEDRLL